MSHPANFVPLDWTVVMWEKETLQKFVFCCCCPMCGMWPTTGKHHLTLFGHIPKIHTPNYQPVTVRLRARLLEMTCNIYSLSVWLGVHKFGLLRHLWGMWSTTGHHHLPCYIILVCHIWYLCVLWLQWTDRWYEKAWAYVGPLVGVGSIMLSYSLVMLGQSAKFGISRLHHLGVVIWGASKFWCLALMVAGFSPPLKFIVWPFRFVVPNLIAMGDVVWEWISQMSKNWDPGGPMSWVKGGFDPGNLPLALALYCTTCEFGYCDVALAWLDFLLTTVY